MHLLTRPAVTHRRLMRMVCLVLNLCAALLLAAATEETRKPFAVPAGPAEKALKQFSEQSGRGVIFVTEVVKGVRTNSVNGEFTASDALAQLVKDTPLVATQDVKTGSYAIRRESGQEIKNDSSRPSSDRAAAITLDKFVVVGTRASLKEALKEKRVAIGVVDGIVAEDMGKFPDLNVSESLQRITGVTIDRSTSGEGNRVSLRGLPPEYVAVTLNGMAAASRNSGREFDFNTFASELFSDIKISKTPSAELTEGGLAGTIDLRTPRPFDFKEGRTLLSASGQYAEFGRGKTTPRVSGLYSWQSPGKKLGILGSASYSESTIRNDTKQGFRYDSIQDTTGLDELVKQQVANGGALPTVRVNGVAINTAAQLLNLAATTTYPILPRVGIDIKDRERLGLTGALQFRPAAGIDITLEVLHATFDERGERHTIDGAPGFSGTASYPTELTVKNDGAVDYAVAGTLNGVSQRVESIEETFQAEFLHATLDGKYQLSDTLAARTELGFSKAHEDELRRSYLYTHVGTFTYDLSDPRWPRFAGTDFNYLNLNDYSIPDRPRFRPLSRDDRLYRGRIDLQYKRDAGALIALKAGLEFSEREKKNTQFLETRPLTTVPFSQVVGTLPVRDFMHGAPAGVVKNFLVVDLDKGREKLLPDSFFQIAGPDLRGSWVVTEQVTGTYLQSEWSLDVANRPLAIDLGVRAARTNQTSDGFRQVGSVFDPVSADNNYSDLLPSLNMRWSLSDRLIARFSANKAITRPTLSQLSAGTTVGSTNTLTATKGNPQLAPFRANQFDVSLEWYFAPEGLVSVTAFSKEMQSFIVNSSVKQVIEGPNLFNDAGQNVSGREFTVTLPVNGTGGKLYGVELSYQRPFTFLPAPFDGLGMVANMTVTRSEGATTQGGQLIVQALQGQSDLSYNLIGYYEKGPFGIRAAYTYRSEYSDQFRTNIWPSGVPHTLYVSPRGQLDLSLRYQLTKAAGLYLDVINLNSANYYSYDTQPGMSRDYFEQGPVYNFGVRIRF